eukprot:2003200-Pleurochrysis_carterae.AAC.1
MWREHCERNWPAWGTRASGRLGLPVQHEMNCADLLNGTASRLLAPQAPKQERNRWLYSWSVPNPPILNVM